MKLEILQENLNSALSILCRIIASKPQMPILSHVLLTAEDNVFTLTGSNLETTIILPVGAKIQTPGRFTVPARTFQELIASLPSGKVLLEFKENSLAISANHFKGSINGTNAADFPELIPSAAKTGPKMILPGDKFLAALGATVFAAATDDSRAALTGVLVKPDEGGLLLAATDGFRLSKVLLEISGNKQPDALSDLIIPARTLTEVGRILTETQGAKESKEDKELTLTFLSDNQIQFTTGDINIYSKVIGGTFPDFEKIIPTKSDIKVELTANEFLSALKTAAIFARDSSNIVKLTLDNKILTISANAAEVGENETTLDVSVNGTPESSFAIAFNFHYLLDFLNSLISSKDVLMEFSGPTLPGIFRPKDNKNYLHIIMPVRVQT